MGRIFFDRQKLLAQQIADNVQTTQQKMKYSSFNKKLFSIDLKSDSYLFLVYLFVTPLFEIHGKAKYQNQNDDNS